MRAQYRQISEGYTADVNDIMISVHCAAHRSALVMTAAAMRVPGVKKVDHILKDVNHLFIKSATRQGAWERYAKKRGVTRFQFPLFGTTRWFSRTECIVVLAQNMNE